jgi:hypothetical protein
MLDRAQAVSDRLVAWRRAIHEHPELSFQEIDRHRPHRGRGPAEQEPGKSCWPHDRPTC